MKHTLSEKRNKEYQCWLEVVRELRFLGVEINNEENLNNFLTEWAKSYHENALAQVGLEYLPEGGTK